MAKVLVIYYSRTGATKKLAEYLAQTMAADIEEVFTEKDRKGIWGYLLSGKEATQKMTTSIKPLQKDPYMYDLVVYGTPIWSYNVSSPIRTVLIEQKARIKKAAFFCTMGGSGDLRAFNDMTAIIGKSPAATLSLTTKDVTSGQYVEKAKDFISKLPING